MWIVQNKDSRFHPVVVLVTFVIPNLKNSLSVAKVILTVVIHLKLTRKDTLKEKFFAEFHLACLTVFCKNPFQKRLKTSQLKIVNRQNI